MDQPYTKSSKLPKSKLEPSRTYLGPNAHYVLPMCSLWPLCACRVLQAAACHQLVTGIRAESNTTTGRFPKRSFQDSLGSPDPRQISRAARLGTFGTFGTFGTWNVMKRTQFVKFISSQPRNLNTFGLNMLTLYSSISKFATPDSREHPEPGYHHASSSDPPWNFECANKRKEKDGRSKNQTEGSPQWGK